MENWKLNNKQFVLLLFPFVFFILIYFTFAFFNPQDIRGIESNVIRTLQLIRSNNSLLYTNPQILPFDIAQYPPLYYAVCDQIMDLFGFGPDPYIIRLFARSISLLCLLLIVFELKKLLISKLEVDKTFSYIILFAAVIFTFPWLLLARPDTMFILFILIGINQLFDLKQSKKNQSLFYCSIAFSLAILTKQTAFLLIPGLLILQLVNKNFRLLFLLSGLIIFFTFLFLLLLNILGYDFAYFKENIIQGINNGIDFKRAYKITYTKYVIYFSMLSSIILFFSYFNFSLFKSNKYFQFLITTNILCFCLSTVTALKSGSAINYYNESIILQLILCGFLFNKINDNSKILIPITIIVTCFQMIFAHISNYTGNLIISNFNSENSTINYHEQISNFLNKNLGNSYYITNDRTIGLDNWKNVALFSLDIHDLNNRTNAYDYTQLHHYIMTGKIRYVIENDPILEFAGIPLDKNFKIVKKVGPFTILQTTHIDLIE